MDKPRTESEGLFKKKKGEMWGWNLKGHRRFNQKDHGEVPVWGVKRQEQKYGIWSYSSKDRATCGGKC